MASPSLLHVPEHRVTLAAYVRRRTGLPLGEAGSLRAMLRGAFGAPTLAGFWRHWNPIFGYGLGIYRGHSSCRVRTGAPLIWPVYPFRSPPTTKPLPVISYSRYALLCWLPRIFTTATTFFSSRSTST
jgi:hypothetical protein